MLGRGDQEDGRKTSLMEKGEGGGGVNKYHKYNKYRKNYK